MRGRRCCPAAHQKAPYLIAVLAAWGGCTAGQVKAEVWTRLKAHMTIIISGVPFVDVISNLIKPEEKNVIQTYKREKGNVVT